VRPAPTIRPATKADAADMVILVDIAGYGLPLWVWSGLYKDESSVLEVGRARARRDAGAFSYRNAHVAEHDGEVAGLLVSYRLDDPYVMPDLSKFPSEFRPAFELEAMVPGSWNVNVIAVYAEFRGIGLGRQLLDHAGTLARAAGAGQMSIIFESRNSAAHRLYRRCGYRELARRVRIPFPGDRTGSEEWVLMTRTVTG
jgi:ribosomal protein S18 acetylase RimI-like enzyme